MSKHGDQLPTRGYSPAALPVFARVPLLPVGVAKRAYQGDLESFVREALRAQDARDALAAASPALHEALARSLNAGLPFERNTLRKAARYLVRMGSRCTPFGLLSAIGPVDVGIDATVRITEYRTAYTRLDATAMMALATHVEASSKSRSTVVVRPSDFVKERGTAFVVYKNSESGRGTQAQLIERTAVVDAVVAMSRYGARIADVVSRLQSLLPINEATASSVVDRLLEAGVLVSSVRAHMAFHSEDDLLSAVEPDASSAQVDAMQQVAHALRQLRGADIARHSTAALADLRQHVLTALGEVHTALQTDSAVHIAGSLPRSVIDDAGLLAELQLLSWAPTALEALARSFAATYEGDVLVPLMDLAESSVLKPLRDGVAPVQRDGFSDVGRSRFAAAIVQALADGRHVELSEAELRSMFDPRFADSLPEFVESGFEVCAGSADDVEQGRYFIVSGGYPGATGVGKNVGRFLHMLPGVRDEIRREIAAAQNDSVCAEVVFVPPSARALNVTVSERIAPYEIQFGLHDDRRENRIALSDLYVGHSGRFFLWSRSLGREVVPLRHDNLFAVGLSTDVVSFVSQIASDGRRGILRFCVPGVEHFPFVPRVVCGRIILSVAKWRLNGIGDETDLRDAFTRWRVPHYVWLVERGDQRLLIDTLSAEGRAQCLSVTKGPNAGADIRLEEAPSVDASWIPGPGGVFVSEFVAQLRSARTQNAITDRVPYAWAARTALYSDGWLSFKLYVEPSVQDHVVRRIVPTILRAVRDATDVRQWHFLRYADPLDHLRVRLQIDPADAEHIAAVVWRLLNDAVAARQIDRTSQDVYRRELERYGGEGCIGYVETLFSRDSEAAVDVIDSTHGEDRLQRAVCSAIGLLVATLGRDGLKVWHRQSAHLNVKMSRDDWDVIRDVERRMSEATDTLATAVADAPPLERRLRFIESVVHMHFNRCGVMGEDETRATRIVWRICQRTARTDTAGSERSQLSAARS